MLLYGNSSFLRWRIRIASLVKRHLAFKEIVYNKLRKERKFPSTTTALLRRSEAVFNFKFLAFNLQERMRG